MPEHTAKDGKVFGNVFQMRKYNDSLAERGANDVRNAPGGPQHESDLREHGVVTEIHIKNEGAGRWRHTAIHADGHESTSVHPEAFRAHQISAQYLGIDQPPAAIQTRQRARSQPVGPKESDRLNREDGREREYEQVEEGQH